MELIKTSQTIAYICEIKRNQIQSVDIRENQRLVKLIKKISEIGIKRLNQILKSVMANLRQLVLAS